VLGPAPGRSSSATAAARCCRTTSPSRVGGLILWFGWYGFNPGSTLSAMDFEGIGACATNTHARRPAPRPLGMFYAYPKTKTWDVSFTVQRLPRRAGGDHVPCYWVSHAARSPRARRRVVVIWRRRPGVAAHRRPDRRGAGARHLRHLGHPVARLLRLRQVRRDGPLGADNSAPLTGLFYGGRTHGLKAQLIGS
jgi:Amt family ammonium transporter